MKTLGEEKFVKDILAYLKEEMKLERYHDKEDCNVERHAGV